MSTPAGYFDENGNFIPGDFAGQFSMPGSTVNQAQVDAANAALTKNKATITGGQNAAKAYNNQIRRYQQQLKNKKLNWAQKASIQAQLAGAKKGLSAANKAVTTAGGQTEALQNKVYEASGQYEKLLSGAGRDAFAALQSMFNQYGLGSLAPKIYEFAKQGYGADVISLLLQDTKEYKTRFAGNQARAAAGLPVLSPAEYLSTEQAYRQILSDAGLPKGFYDSPTDFTKWIAGDASPTEIKGRVDLAVANSMQVNSWTKQALSDLYGVDQSYVTAYFLDKTRALPLLQKQSQAAQFGAEALKRGLQMNQGRLEDYVTAGLSQSAVSQGFQAVAEALPNIQAIAARYGEGFTQSELEQDFIENGAGGSVNSPTALGQAPTNKRKRLASQERALFSGFGGASPGGLSTGYQQT